MDKPETPARKRRSFTPEFKAEAVRLCRVGDRSIGQVAADLNLTESALRGWAKQATVDSGGGPAGALTTEERNELTRLRRENKRLLVERDILKNATAVSIGQRNALSAMRSASRRGRGWPQQAAQPLRIHVHVRHISATKALRLRATWSWQT